MCLCSYFYYFIRDLNWLVYIGVFYGICDGMIGWVIFGKIIGVWSDCFWWGYIVEVAGVKWGFCGR